MDNLEKSRRREIQLGLVMDHFRDRDGKQGNRGVESSGTVVEQCKITQWVLVSVFGQFID
jgi:hypothetical protein